MLKTQRSSLHRSSKPWGRPPGVSRSMSCDTLRSSNMAAGLENGPFRNGMFLARNLHSVRGFSSTPCLMTRGYPRCCHIVGHYMFFSVRCVSLWRANCLVICSMGCLVHLTSIEILRNSLTELMPEMEWRIVPFTQHPTVKDKHLQRPIEDVENKQKV